MRPPFQCSRARVVLCGTATLLLCAIAWRAVASAEQPVMVGTPPRQAVSRPRTSPAPPPSSTSTRTSTGTPSTSPVAPGLRVLLYGSARDEASTLEWLVHHKLLGFSHALVFDHLSVEPLEPLVRRAGLASFATVVRRTEDVGHQTVYMMDAHAYAMSHGFDWLLATDLDEFLALPRHATVQGFLAEFDAFDQVGINFLIFGSSNFTRQHPGGLLESYTRSDASFDKHVKPFLHIAHANAKVILGLANPHVFLLHSMELSVGVDRRPLGASEPWFHPGLTRTPDVAYLAHYYYQAYDVFTRRKVKRRRGDNGEYRESISEAVFHTLSSDVENRDMADRYGPRVAAALASSSQGSPSEEDTTLRYP